jgi:homoserine kinase
LPGAPNARRTSRNAPRSAPCSPRSTSPRARSRRRNGITATPTGAHARQRKSPPSWRQTTPACSTTSCAINRRLARTTSRKALIHADLFRDNVLFSGDRVSGVLDFYFSGVDDLLFDLAVTVNDWCVTAKATLDGQRCAALLGAYDARRPLLPAEQAAWPTLLRAAALRFWVSRLHDHHLPRPGDLVARRDPDAYRSILQARVASGDEAPWLASPAQGD